MNKNTDILKNYHINLAAKDDEVETVRSSTNLLILFVFSVTVGWGPTGCTSSFTKKRIRRYFIFKMWANIVVQFFSQLQPTLHKLKHEDVEHNVAIKMVPWVQVAV